MKIEKRQVNFIETLAHAVQNQTFEVYNGDTFEVEEVKHFIEHNVNHRDSFANIQGIVVKVKSKRDTYNAFHLSATRQIKEGVIDPFGFIFEIEHFESSFGNGYNYIREAFRYCMPVILGKVAKINGLEIKRNGSITTISLYINASTQEKYNNSCKEATKVLKDIVELFNNIAKEKLEEHKEKQKQAMEFFKNRAEKKEVEEKSFVISVRDNKFLLKEDEIKELKKQLATL